MLNKLLQETFIFPLICSRLLFPSNDLRMNISAVQFPLGGSVAEVKPDLWKVELHEPIHQAELRGTT